MNARLGLLPIGVLGLLVACGGPATTPIAPVSLPPIATPAPIATPTPTPTTRPTAPPTATPTPTATPISVPIVIPTATPQPARPPTFGVPFFVGGGSGDCTHGLTFDAPSQLADIALSEPGYTGAFTATSSDTTVAVASVANSVLTITAQHSGTARIAVSDTSGNAATCAVAVN